MGPLTKALQGATDGGAYLLFDCERGTTQSLHWEGGNSDDLSLDWGYSAIIGTDCRHWY
jgi:hypothetical protein